jgi:hypothetical protein
MRNIYSIQKVPKGYNILDTLPTLTHLCKIVKLIQFLNFFFILKNKIFFEDSIFYFSKLYSFEFEFFFLKSFQNYYWK